MTAETSGQTALTMALELETKVTASIREVIKECEATCEKATCEEATDKKFNHYHVSISFYLIDKAGLTIREI
jgi:enamine deaminase RidA (YjgF/YER057c/UK114 family)